MQYETNKLFVLGAETEWGENESVISQDIIKCYISITFSGNGATETIKMKLNLNINTNKRQQLIGHLSNSNVTCNT